jgi:hypothetical protein
MQLSLDSTLYEEQQAIFVREMVQSVRVKLQEAGLDGAKLEEAAAGIAFSIASMIDDTSAIEAGGCEVHPYLTFRTADGVLTHCGENSYTHEFVYEALEQIIQERAD